MADVIIVGASARAAAESTIRAGLRPWCIDLFLDADLRAMSPTSVRCPFDRYPQGFVDLLADAPAAPWMYTGGLENHPEVVTQLARWRPLWGNQAEALQRARSPWFVRDALIAAGLLAPDLGRFDEKVASGRCWLRKPLDGSGGRGISELNSSVPPRPGHYQQAFVDGTSMSAVFVRARGETRLLGVTEQLIGCDWIDAPPFGYAGSIGPIPLSPELQDELDRIGRCIGERCELLGLFGVDFIFDGDRPWVIEVNPRYTASIEVLERATGLRAISHHRSAFDSTAVVTDSPPGRPWQAKGIVYASRRMVVGHLLEGPHLADVPNPGESIEVGWPVMTCLAEGDDRAECESALRERVMEVRGAIDRWSE